jgi:hypothetical protein
MEDQLKAHVVAYFTDVFVNRLFKKADKRHTDST